MAGSIQAQPDPILQHLRAIIPGLPKFCTRVVLTLEVDHYPKVDVTFHPEAIDVTNLSSAEPEYRPGGPELVTRSYRLVPDSGPTSAKCAAYIAQVS